ncbi:MAG TPA: hypothetical protein VGM73_07380 [Candidatus Didemnitutus sp.]|jgi:hypothetical protein
MGHIFLLASVLYASGEGDTWKNSIWDERIGPLTIRRFVSVKIVRGIITITSARIPIETSSGACKPGSVTSIQRCNLADLDPKRIYIDNSTRVGDSREIVAYTKDGKTATANFDMDTMPSEAAPKYVFIACASEKTAQVTYDEILVEVATAKVAH